MDHRRWSPADAGPIFQSHRPIPGIIPLQFARQVGQLNQVLRISGNAGQAVTKGRGQVSQQPEPGLLICLIHAGPPVKQFRERNHRGRRQGNACRIFCLFIGPGSQNISRPPKRKRIGNFINQPSMDFVDIAVGEIGAVVMEAVVYRTVVPEVSKEALESLIACEPDIVTFTSSSTARNFCNILGQENLERLSESAAFASIGPQTTKTAGKLGLEILVEAAHHDVPGLVNVLREWAM